MKTDELNEVWSVRPPWRDEVARWPQALQEALTRRGVRRHWLWVLVAGELERIVGAITLAERDPAGLVTRPEGRIDFVMQPAWLKQREPVEALLSAAVEKARGLGLSPVTVQSGTDDCAAAWLIDQGFTPNRKNELWRVPFASNYERRATAIERSLLRRPVDIRALDAAALPAVRAICASYELLSESRVTLAKDGRDGFDQRLSFIAGPPDAPTAILLARSHGKSVYLEVLARAPECVEKGPEVGALLYAFFRAAQSLGATETLCLFASDVARDTERLLLRADAQRIEQFALFVRD